MKKNWRYCCDLGLMIKLGMAIEKTNWIGESVVTIVIKDQF